MGNTLKGSFCSCSNCSFLFLTAFGWVSYAHAVKEFDFFQYYYSFLFDPSSNLYLKRNESWGRYSLSLYLWTLSLFTSYVRYVWFAELHPENWDSVNWLCSKTLTASGAKMTAPSSQDCFICPVSLLLNLATFILPQKGTIKTMFSIYRNLDRIYSLTCSNVYFCFSDGSFHSAEIFRER